MPQEFFQGLLPVFDLGMWRWLSTSSDYVNNKLAHQNESEQLNHHSFPSSEEANHLETENDCSPNPAQYRQEPGPAPCPTQKQTYYEAITNFWLEMLIGFSGLFILCIPSKASYKIVIVTLSI